VAAKVVLGAVTALLFSSIGGAFVALPALVPLHVLAARSSGRFGRAAWCSVSGTGMAMAAWAATYLLVGEHKPVIWLAPLIVLAVGTTFVYRLSAPHPEVPA
jgi:hypothetical protein